IASLDLATGAASSWNPNANGPVFALALDGSTVYAGGLFSHIGGADRRYIAALDGNGQATAWNANASGTAIYAEAVSGPTADAGGLLNSSGGQRRTYAAALDAGTGLATDWTRGLDGPPAVFAIPPTIPVAAGTSGIASGASLYVGGTFSF